MVFDGKINTTASNGQIGTVLFDPRNIFITNAATPSGQVQVDTAGEFAELMANLDPILDYYVSPTQLLTLAGGSNISLLADNNINFNDDLTLTGTKSLVATTVGGDININNALISDTGSITLNSGNNININNNVSSSGNISFNANNDITLNNSTVQTTNANISLTPTNGKLTLNNSTAKTNNSSNNITLNTNWLTVDNTSKIVTNKLNKQWCG